MNRKQWRTETSNLSPIHTGRDARSDTNKWSQVPFVRMILHRLLLSVQCVQDCCYNRICTTYNLLRFLRRVQCGWGLSLKKKKLSDLFASCKKCWWPDWNDQKLFLTCYRLKKGSVFVWTVKEQLLRGCVSGKGTKFDDDAVKFSTFVSPSIQGHSHWAACTTKCI